MIVICVKTEKKIFHPINPYESHLCRKGNFLRQLRTIKFPVPEESLCPPRFPEDKRGGWDIKSVSQAYPRLRTIMTQSIKKVRGPSSLITLGPLLRPPA
ncbi:hypothetical protein NPIL_106291 [Nephila pilipes]|uniref:Uncharacterized protein n=1 Tax=Nephila pilipes TaxID=299642 RepID=A0A8X6TWU4_NEPPI|nr:hypothetical protein NPIL_106291 [Nephila pilipes]